MSEQESMSERELAEYLTDEVFSGQPRSVGEALQAADEQDPEPPVEPEHAPVPDAPEPPPEPTPHEEPPVVITDTPEQQGEPAPGPEIPPSEPERDDEKEPEALLEEEEEEVPHLAWAKKKYGDDPDKWAKAAFDQEQHISRMANQLREAEQLAVQWYEYAQQAEQQATQQSSMAMPLSAGEEQWVEQAMMNPLEYARQAAWNGNVQLFNAILERVAEENAGYAANIGAQIQTELRQAADVQAQQQQQANGPPMTLQQALGGSFQRLGIDLEKAGPSMSEKLGELGEYHPYVQAILNGDDAQRDLAVQAVYDLTRAGTLTKRVVRDEQRAGQIKREGELRREAAGVVQGSPHVTPPKEDPFMAAMEEEWKARRQWGDE